MISLVGLDGDDTLWHNETIFSLTHERFRSLLAPYVHGDRVDERMLECERANLRLYGYGVKAFTLSMIETAVALTDGRVTAAEISVLLDLGKEMLDHPVELLDGVEAAVEELSGSHRLVLVTKGDLFNQESKLSRTGLGDRFSGIEIVSEKDEKTYRSVLRRYDTAPEEFVMVGNSLRSDVLPVVSIGGRAVHVPYEVTWALEEAEVGDEHAGRWWHLDSLSGLVPLLEWLDAA